MGPPRYEITSHTADVGLLVRGDTLGELLVNGGRGLNQVMFGRQPDGRGDTRTVSVDSSSVDTLLVDWLNELLYLFEVEHLVFSTFIPDAVSETHARIRCEGGAYDSNNLEATRDVKAATYHMARVSRGPDGLEAQVILDI